MRFKEWLRTAARVTIVAVLTFGCLGASAANASKLYWGIGTGLQRLNAEGDQGLNLPVVGSVIAEIDLDPDDFQDMMETAFGFGGYVSDGQWIVKYQLAQLKLGGDPSGTLPGGGTYVGEWSFDILTGGATFGYPVYQEGRLTVSPYGGVRYMKHKLGAELAITGGTTASAERSTDYNWTDAVIGLAVDVSLAPKWGWSSSADASFGGSEGNYSFATSVSWRALNWLSVGPTFNYAAVEFLNGEFGDSDFYLYDANEFGAGLSVLFHF